MGRRALAVVVVGIALGVAGCRCGHGVHPPRPARAPARVPADPAAFEERERCSTEIADLVRDGRTEDAIARDRECTGYAGSYVADALLVDARFAEAHARYRVERGFAGPEVLAALAVDDRFGAIEAIEDAARRWSSQPASERCLGEAIRVKVGDAAALARLRGDPACTLFALETLPEDDRRAELDRLLAAEPASTDWWERVLLRLELDPDTEVDLGRELGLPDCNTDYLLWRHGSSPRTPALLAHVGEHLDAIRSPAVRAAIAAGIACFEISAGEHERAQSWLARATRDAATDWQAQLVAEVATALAIRTGDVGARVDLDRGALLGALRIARGERDVAFVGWRGYDDDQVLAALARGDLVAVADETGDEPAWVWPLIVAPSLDDDEQTILRDRWLRGVHRIPVAGAASQVLGWHGILADAARALGDPELEERHRARARAWRELMLRRDLALVFDALGH